VISNYWPFSRDQNGDRPGFICLQVHIGDGSVNEDGSFGRLEHSCGALTINNEAFWENGGEDEPSYAPLQVAAFLVAFSTVAGAITFVHLLSASCFALTPCKLVFLMTAQIVCAFFSLSSIFVASGDPCHNLSSCKRYPGIGIRLDEGAVAVVFSVFFYGWAAITVCNYRREVMASKNNDSQQPQRTAETKRLVLASAIEPQAMMDKTNHDYEEDSGDTSDVERAAYKGENVSMKSKEPPAYTMQTDSIIELLP